MTTVVGATLLDVQMTQQRIPDTVGDIFVVKWFAQGVAEDLFGNLAGGILLLLECVIDDLRHCDLAL